jgi:DNA-binding PadR family transcriptional regulator
LEIFVLAAVRAGLDSAYDLNKSADLSLGATLPLLSRLEANGLLRSKLAARRCKQYSMTTQGRLVLQHSWQKLLTAIPREYEAILRVAYLTAVMDTNLKITRQFLKAAGNERRQLAIERQSQAESIQREVGQQAFGWGHRWLRAHSDSVRLQSEASVLAGLSTRKDLREVLQIRRW